jgi:hypothetical protein
MSLTFQTELDNEPIEFPAPDSEDQRARLQDLIEAAEELVSTQDEDSAFGAAWNDLRFALESVSNGTTTNTARLRYCLLIGLNNVHSIVVEKRGVSDGNLYELYDAPLAGRYPLDREAAQKAREWLRRRVDQLERTLDAIDADLAREGR